MGVDTPLRLTLRRSGDTEPLHASLTSAITEVAPVTVRPLPGGVGYIKVSLLTEKSGSDVKQALLDLPKQTGLVLDLRGNPGGQVEPVKEIASALTNGGTIYAEMGPGARKHLVATPVGRRVPRRVVVLVDRGTASSAELLAAALRDKGVGTLAGRPTFGDSYLQTLYPLSDGSAYWVNDVKAGKLKPPYIVVDIPALAIETGWCQSAVNYKVFPTIYYIASIKEGGGDIGDYIEDRLQLLTDALLFPVSSTVFPFLALDVPATDTSASQAINDSMLNAEMAYLSGAITFSALLGYVHTGY